MQEFVALAGIIGALAGGVVSPGPSFVMVVRVAVATSRANGVCAAVGMGVGGGVFAVAALFGLLRQTGPATGGSRWPSPRLEVENMAIKSMLEWLAVSGDVGRQIKDLPSGTQIRLDVRDA